MKYIIPHPLDKLDLSFMKKFSNLAGVFVKAPTGHIGSLRDFAHDPSLSSMKQLCRDLHSEGFEVNVTLNATCLGGEQFKQSWVWKTLDFLNLLSVAEVDELIITDPYLIKMIKNYGFSFKIAVSVLALVLTPTRAQYFDNMDVDMITLPPDLNRNLTTIKEIRESVACDLAVIVNEGCLLDCPFRVPCYNFMTHGSTGRMNVVSNAPLEEGPPLPPFYYFADNMMKMTEPEHILASGWIRPEDLKEYEDIGVEYCKISGRGKPWAFVKTCLQAYHDQSFDGNFFELLDGMPRIVAGSAGYPEYGIPPYFISPPYLHVNNRDLDGFFEKVKNCPKNCKKCGICKQFAKKYVTVHEVFREPTGIYKAFVESGRIYPWPPELPVSASSIQTL